MASALLNSDRIANAKLHGVRRRYLHLPRFRSRTQRKSWKQLFERSAPKPVVTNQRRGAAADWRELERLRQCAATRAPATATTGYRSATTSCGTRADSDGQSIVVRTRLQRPSHQ